MLLWLGTAKGDRGILVRKKMKQQLYSLKY